MEHTFSQEQLRQMASRWLPAHKVPRRFRIHTDTTDFFRVDYDDVVQLQETPYLIRHNAKELRFGLADEIKYWVKRSIDLKDGSPKIIKLVFFEKFMSRIGNIAFECFRSPRKEARILKLVADHKNFMHGYGAEDEKGNIVRVLEFIKGDPLSTFLEKLDMGHERYYFEFFPSILDQFMDCIRAIGFLHTHRERHGDIRRDHIIIDRDTGLYRWIDFDFNLSHGESIYAYDIFGLGNILVFLVGKGDILLQDLGRQGHAVFDKLNDDDVNIVFRNRLVNLKKLYPYIPESMNRVLLHFSNGANWFYEHTLQLIEDLEECKGSA